MVDRFRTMDEVTIAMIAGRCRALEHHWHELAHESSAQSPTALARPEA
jgi:hypothetical protein